MTYQEQSTNLAGAASVAVMVLMGAPNDVEFIPIKPVSADAKMLSELKTRWPGRGLRSVGVLGLVGETTRCALKELLEPEQIQALAAAFAAYVHIVINPESPRDDVEWLERLYALPDTRMEA